MKIEKRKNIRLYSGRCVVCTDVVSNELYNIQANDSADNRHSVNICIACYNRLKEIIGYEYYCEGLERGDW